MNIYGSRYKRRSWDQELMIKREKSKKIVILRYLLARKLF